MPIDDDEFNEMVAEADEIKREQIDSTMRLDTMTRIATEIKAARLSEQALRVEHQRAKRALYELLEYHVQRGVSVAFLASCANYKERSGVTKALAQLDRWRDDDAAAEIMESLQMKRAASQPPDSPSA